MTKNKHQVGRELVEFLSQEASIPRFWKFSYNPKDIAIRAEYTRETEDAKTVTVIEFGIRDLTDCYKYFSICKLCTVEAFHEAVEHVNLYPWEKNPSLLN